MTAEAGEDAAAAKAARQGEAFAAEWAAASERQSRPTEGSAVETSQAGLHPGPEGVDWPSPSTAGQPPAVSPQPTSSPNVTDPRDNSQSYS